MFHTFSPVLDSHLWCEDPKLVYWTVAPLASKQKSPVPVRPSFTPSHPCYPPSGSGGD